MTFCTHKPGLFCLDCETIGHNPQGCECCGSGAIYPVMAWLNRTANSPVMPDSSTVAEFATVQSGIERMANEYVDWPKRMGVKL